MSASSTLAQDEISAIPFDAVPDGTKFNGGGASIELQGDTEVSGTLTATGVIGSDIGVRFPDSTLQSTAAAGASTTANQGQYSNTIADFTPPNAYTEICIKAGMVAFDIHAASESTQSGNCLPGDVGWIIERFEREAGAQVTWYSARLECLKNGMRLPESFEWRVTCDDSATFAVSDMEDLWEWTSNGVEGEIAGGTTVLTAMVMGNGSCSHGAVGTASNEQGVSTTWEYRCAL